MTTIEVSLKDAMAVQNIVNDMRHLRGQVNWISTTAFQIEDEDLAEETVEELVRLELEIECYY